MEKVTFYNADRKFVFKGKTKLKLFIEDIFKKERKRLSCINYIFCSDEYLLKINQEFLQHNYYTDVITFDLTMPQPQSPKIEAEVYISLDRVNENATINKTAKKDEALRVVFHAALHLCGYNDKKKSEILEMRKKEEHYLFLYNKQNKQTMFHVKRFASSLLFLLFFNGALAQYTHYTYSFKPEPQINLVDNEINENILLQTQEIHLSNQEKELLYWMDFARKYPKQFYDEVITPYADTYPEMMKQNKYLYLNTLKKTLYSSAPLPLLVLDKNLQAMAKEHAADAKEYDPAIGHSSSTGLTFQQRAKKFGLICAGENLSYGESSVLMQLILLYLDINQPKLGHRKNLLDPRFTNIGLALVSLNNKEIFFVQDFSCTPENQ